MKSLQRWLDRKQDADNMATCFDFSEAYYNSYDDEISSDVVEVWKFFERFESLGTSGCYQSRPAKIDY